MARVPGTDLSHAYTVPTIHQRDADPTVDDDSTKGYCLGDEWYTPSALYKALSIRPGEALWAKAGTKDSVGGGSAAMWSCNLVTEDVPTDSEFHAVPIGPGTVEGDASLIATLQGEGMIVATAAAVVSIKLWVEFAAASNKADTRIAIETEIGGDKQEHGQNGVYSSIAQASYDGYVRRGEIIRPSVRCMPGDALTILPSSYMTVLVFEAPPPPSRRS